MGNLSRLERETSVAVRLHCLDDETFAQVEALVTGKTTRWQQLLSASGYKPGAGLREVHFPLEGVIDPGDIEEVSFIGTGKAGFEKTVGGHKLVGPGSAFVYVVDRQNSSAKKLVISGSLWHCPDDGHCYVLVLDTETSFIEVEWVEDLGPNHTCLVR